MDAETLPPDGAVPAEEIEQMSVLIARADCRRFERCSPLTFASYFRDQAACEASLGLGVAAGLRGRALSGLLLLSRERVEACIRLSAGDCRTPSVYEACEGLGDGRLREGETCSNREECREGLTCRGSSGCGRCETPLVEGTGCDPAQLLHGCAGTCGLDGHCQRRLGLGDECVSEGPPCPYPTACQDGRCGSRPGPGEVCTDLTGPGPFCAPGLDSCEGAVCAPIEAVRPGEACDLGTRRCAGRCLLGSCMPPSREGERCEAPTDCDLSATICVRSTCVARAQVGAPCAWDGDCALNAWCVLGGCTAEPWSVCSHRD